MRELKVLLILCFALATPATRGDDTILHIQTTTDSVTVGNTLSFSATHDTAGDVTTTEGTRWSVDNSQVATISAAGVLTAVAPGQVIVRVVNDELTAAASGSLVIHVYAADDTDSDGMPNDWETQYGLDANDAADAQLDGDQDELTNIEELQHQSKPNDPDTDGDGRLDGDEVVNGLDPTVSEVLVEPRRMNSNCVVSILNRVARVRANGSWVLTNIPATGQQVRARATCQQFGMTEVGQSGFIVVPPNGQLQNVVIDFSNPIPVPGKLALTATRPSLDEAGSTLQLTATITYSNNTTADATQAIDGTNYLSSNPRIATVSADGEVTAVAPGGVNITATNEGTLALLHVEVTGYTDTDHDGMADDWETDHGFNPNDANDGDLDADQDGLKNLAEFQQGSDPHATDTDADGVWDGLEVQLGTSPIDPSSVDMHRALTSIAVKPSSFTITMTPTLRYVTRQIRVVGTMTDGHTVDLTAAAKGTAYTSSDLTIANFENGDGKVAGGNPGSATITVTSSGFTANAPVTVRQLDPAVSWLAMPGVAENVKVAGNYAYVAAGSAGLVVVDVTNRKTPFIAATLSLPGGYASDVRLDTGIAYVAGGPIGLQVVDIRNPQSPSVIGSLDTPGDARDIALAPGHLLYLADGPGGLRVISIADPAAPAEIGALASALEMQAVAAGGTNVYALIGNADRFAGNGTLVVIDVRTPSAPATLGSIATNGCACDLAVSGSTAYVAARTVGMRIYNVANPAAIQLQSSIVQFYPLDVVVVNNWAFFAEELRVNGIPQVNVTNPASPFYAASLDLDPFGDADGHGLDVDERFAYLAADSELYIAQHHDMTDEDGVAPVVQIATPPANATLVIGDRAPMRLTVTDDIGVAQVTTTLNGVIVPELSKPPYVSVVTLPTNTTTVTLDVTARDFAGNTAHVAQTHTIGPDPKTTVTGRVIMAEGIPAAGAILTVGGQSATADGQGVYTIGNVATIDGDLVVKAVLHDGGRTVDGQAPPVTPVRGGTTPVADIHLRAGLHALVTAAVPAGTPLVEWQPLSITVSAGDDAPARADYVRVEVNGVLVKELYSYDLPSTTFDITVPGGLTSLTILATAYDDQNNIAPSRPLTFPVVADTGGTLTGFVKGADGTPVAGAQVTIRESRYDDHGLYIQATLPLDAAYEEIKVFTDANGAWTIPHVNTYRGSVSASAVKVANGVVQLTGRSAPQTVTRDQTTAVADILVSAPATPVIAKLALDTFGNWAETYGNRLGIANGMAAHFFDISDPTRPHLGGSILVGGDSWDWMNVINFIDNGQKAIVISDTPRLYVVDLSDINHPAKMGELDLPSGYPVSAASTGSITIIANEELQIVDTSNPAAPVLLSSLALPQNASYVYLSGHYAIVSESLVFSGAGINSGIDVVDISDPAHPVLVSHTAMSDSVGPMVIRGTRGYAPNDNEINLFDFTDPAHPVFTPNVTPLSPFSTWCSTSSGSRIILAGDNNPGRIALADPVATPDAPAPLGEIALPETTQYTIPYLAGAGDGKYVGILGWPRRDSTLPWQIGSGFFLAQLPGSTTP
jgi:uncharacterized protein YjdB